VTIVLLRGINVSGHRKVPMADLRDALGADGFKGVQTYIQSGNLVFPGRVDSDDGHAAIVDVLERVLLREFGLDDVPVVVRSDESVGRALTISTDAFPPPAEGDAGALRNHGRFTHVVFLGSKPAQERRASLAPDELAPDRFHLDLHAGGADLHVTYANGVSGSKLTSDRIERAFGVSATARNLNTVTRLVEMTSPTS